MTPPSLRRELGLRDLVLFNVAAVLGIRWLAAAAQTGTGSLVLWLLAAVFFFVPSALAVATLSAKFPQEGGIYVWTREGFGPWHGFLCGWCYWLNNLFYFPTLVLTGVAMAYQPLGLAGSKLLVLATALAVIWLALITNTFGLEVGKWTSNAGALATYAAGVLLIAMGAWVWARWGPATPLRLGGGWDLSRVNFWSQIAFAFGGLELGAVMAGEIRDPRRTIARAAGIAGAAIAAFYVLGTLALLALLPPDRISILTGLVEGGEAAGTRLGHPGIVYVLIALVLASVAGQMGAWIGGGARIPFAIGVDRYLPEWFARVHPRWGTPYLAILWQGVVCTVFVIGLQAGANLRAGYQLLVDMTVITYFIPYAYLFGAAWKHGRRWSAAAGMAVTAVSLAVSLIPFAEAGSTLLFEGKLLGGCAVIIGSAWLCFRDGPRPVLP